MITITPAIETPVPTRVKMAVFHYFFDTLSINPIRISEESIFQIDNYTWFADITCSGNKIKLIIKEEENEL